MANPTLGSLIAEVRTQSGEVDPSGRWPDAQIAPLIHRAEVDLGLLLEWPEATWYFQTVANVNEYKLADTVNILRVRVGGPPGQAFVPTTIDMLEGTNLGLFDNSQTSPPYTAQWMTQPPLAAPVQQNLGYPAPLTVPWTMGNRPSYYLRGAGAVIGFVPALSIGVIVQLDCIGEPNTLAEDTDESSFPDKAVQALVYQTMYYMAKADRNNEAMLANAMQYGGQDGTGGEVGKLLSWKQGTPKHKSRAPLFVTARTMFQGPARCGSGRGRLGA